MLGEKEVVAETLLGRTTRQRVVIEACGAAGKLELAMHTGNVGSPFRKRLAAVAEKNPETMLGFVLLDI